MFQIIWIVIVGAILGFLAKLLLPGRQAIPIWLTVLCGMVGALLGNYISSVIGVRHTSGIDWIRHLLQVVGALVVVAAGSALYPQARSRN
ncbi:GlsB/YeaQ/YmgE family stress response membrane protein [Streptacidiphilus sp. PB12-B1b]|uniref:GlsB/YeaQ/YmgE family stress response membrane protein n=1 Tax=Streptacidiphilus sp. PB12-B1b TaxID=2705012 RepID=UPI0015FB6E5F|nr:GlsB/YeaQ/YmgE family stress response membrane protein [Streptacidiphilus sp. PB12-B1b]QMU75459.1 GlsB/YeaQ/YmgE family stress response membrane protein [Streptacidiphilus sp. PB12-B1b]